MPTGIVIDGTPGGAFADQPGSDRITFGANAATLTASQGSDTVFAGSGLLLIDASGNTEPVSVQGAGGRLVFVGGPGPATVAGGAGPVTVLPGNGQINLIGAGTPIDIYSADSWSGYYEFTPPVGDTLSLIFNGAAGDIEIVDPAAGRTIVVGQGFAYYQTDPGALLDFTEPPGTIDGLTPGTHSGGSADAFATTDSAPVLTGAAPALSTVTITTAAGAIVGQPVLADALGRWAAPLSRLPLGATDLIAQVSIDSSLPSFESSAVVTLHILPAPPSVDGFTDGGGLTSGSGSTLDRRPQIDGATPAGTTVQVFANGALLGDAVVSGTAWTYDPPADLPETSYILTAVATDPGTGVASEASAPLTLAVALAPPVADGFTDAAGFMAGGATLDHRPALSGTNPDGAAVSVYDGGALVGSASVAGATWSFTRPPTSSTAPTPSPSSQPTRPRTSAAQRPPPSS